MAAPQALSPYLNQFGITGVDNALPQATPTILAFLRGMGMSWDSLGEQRTQQLNSLSQQSQLAKQAIQTQGQRQQRGLTADTVARGQMSGGLAGQRAADLSTDINQRQNLVDVQNADSVGNVDLGFKQGQNQLRQGALERLLQDREGQDVQKAQQGEMERQNKQMMDFYNQQHTDALAAAEAQRQSGAAALAQQQAQYDALMRQMQPNAEQAANNARIQQNYDNQMLAYNSRPQAAPAQPGYYGNVPGASVIPGLNSIFNTIQTKLANPQMTTIKQPTQTPTPVAGGGLVKRPGNKAF